MDATFPDKRPWGPPPNFGRIDPQPVLEAFRHTLNEEMIGHLQHDIVHAVRLAPFLFADPGCVFADAGIGFELHPGGETSGQRHFVI